MCEEQFKGTWYLWIMDTAGYVDASDDKSYCFWN